jgi:hypothetical protein
VIHRGGLVHGTTTLLRRFLDAPQSAVIRRANPCRNRHEDRGNAHRPKSKQAIHGV